MKNIKEIKYTCVVLSNLPISVNEDGQVIPINENSDDSDNVIDSNHTDYDYGNYLDN